MKKLVFAMLISTIGITSCSEEEISADNGLNSPANAVNGETFITPLYNAVYQASEQCNKYELYASANGNIVNYEREVLIIVLKDEDNSIIDQVTVRIPAGQNLSNKRDVMENASQEYGDVRLQIGNVLPDDDSTWRDLEFFASNCYTKAPKLPKGFPCKPDKPCIVVESPIDDPNYGGGFE